jgi:hypothetical protein
VVGDAARALRQARGDGVGQFGAGQRRRVAFQAAQRGIEQLGAALHVAIDRILPMGQLARQARHQRNADDPHQHQEGQGDHAGRRVAAHAAIDQRP